MLRKSFNLVFKNPLILVWSLFHTVSMVYIAFVTLTVPMAMFAGLGAYNVFNHVSEFSLMFFGVIAVFTIFFISPSGLQYIYEVSSDALSSGWYIRGLKRNCMNVLNRVVVGLFVGFFVGMVGYISWGLVFIIYAVYIAVQLIIYTVEDGYKAGRLNEKLHLNRLLFKTFLIQFIPYLLAVALYYGISAIFTRLGVEASGYKLLGTINIYFAAIALVFGIITNAITYTHCMISYTTLRKSQVADTMPTEESVEPNETLSS